MDFSEVFTIPKRPRLEFGVLLDEICEHGNLHPALKDLFLKAYLNVKQDSLSEDNNECQPTATSRAVLALQPGPEGQGSLSQRMHLKSKLESGEWLIPLRTPVGAPLWLLRHFLGRLPRPLLKGAQWRATSRACATSILSSPDVGRVVQRLSEMTRSLSRSELEVTALLALLLRKLSSRWDPQRNEEVHDEESLSALSQYFIGSITARPFRPGLYTAADRELEPLLMFLSRYWRVIFQGAQMGRPRGNSSPPIRSLPIRHCESAPEIRRRAELDELHLPEMHRLRETSDGPSDRGEEQVQPDRRANFIGFEPLMIAHGRKQSNRASNGNVTTEDNSIQPESRLDECGLATDHSSDLRRFQVGLFLEDSVLEIESSPFEGSDGKIETKSLNTQNGMSESLGQECLFYNIATSSSSRETADNVRKNEESIDQQRFLMSDEELFLSKTYKNNSFSQSDSHPMEAENNVFSECEYFSVPDSEDA